jgi:hypothetical protein
MYAKEAAMEALVTLLTLTLLRLVIPFGLLLLIGTLIERGHTATTRKEVQRWNR